MEKLDYTASISVNTTPAQAFKSINNVSKWWTENVEGRSEKLNDEFIVRSGDIHIQNIKLLKCFRIKRLCGRLPIASLTG